MKSFCTHNMALSFPRKVVAADGSEVMVLGSIADIVMGAICGALVTDPWFIGFTAKFLGESLGANISSADVASPSFGMAFLAGFALPTLLELLANRLQAIRKEGGNGVSRVIPAVIISAKMLR